MKTAQTSENRDLQPSNTVAYAFTLFVGQYLSKQLYTVQYSEQTVLLITRVGVKDDITTNYCRHSRSLRAM